MNENMFSEQDYLEQIKESNIASTYRIAQHLNTGASLMMQHMNTKIKTKHWMNELGFLVDANKFLSFDGADMQKAFGELQDRAYHRQQERAGELAHAIKNILNNASNPVIAFAHAIKPVQEFANFCKMHSKTLDDLVEALRNEYNLEPLPKIYEASEQDENKGVRPSLDGSGGSVGKK